MLHVPPDYELVIRPSHGWFNLNLRDIWRYRDLMMLLVRRDFVAKYKQTILGPLWFILQPLLLAAVFVVIFGRVAGIPTDGLPPPLFYLAGLLAWSYFAQTFQSTAGTLITNAGLFGKVYFPRLVVPLSGALANFFALLLQLATFLIVWSYFKLFTPAGSSFGFSGALMWLPLLFVQLAALSLGVGLWLSALTAKYRDFAHLTTFIIQIWMYATPVIYPLSQVPEHWRWLVTLNPMAVPVEVMRLMFLGSGVAPAAYVFTSIAMTLVLLVSGVILFSKVEKTFVDTV